MLLYYGADPNLGDPNRNPLTPALLFNQSNLVEHLYNLLFIPKECPLNLIIATMVSHSEFFGPIITQIEEVYRTYEIEDLSHLIVASDPNDFKVFFNRFPYLGFEIVEAYLYSSHVRQDFDQNLENLKLIVENNELIYELALNVHHENMYTPVVSDNALLFVFFTMSLGVPLPFSEFERVRNKFGRSSELFKILRHMDIVRNMLGDVCEWCFLFETSIHMINIITDDVSVVNCVSNHLKLHNFFATPFNIKGNQYNNAYRWDNMKPIVPLLTELCREAARKHIIKTFSIKTLGMFLSLVQRLPIDPLSKRQLTYEQPLYNIV